jgi:hypothetical protein
MAGDPGDDGLGSESHSSSLMDHTHTFLHPQDIIPFLQHFQMLGAPLGLHLNLTKTKLLTTTTEMSIRNQPSTPHTEALIQALDYIQQQDPSNPDPEVATGVWFLGQPLGSREFANQYLATAATTYKDNLTKLCTHLTDCHSMFQLFKSCPQPSLQHLIASDIYYNCDPDNPDNPHSWTSSFQTAITQVNAAFLASLGDTHSLPDTAWQLARHPFCLGGA